MNWKLTFTRLTVVSAIITFYMLDSHDWHPKSEIIYYKTIYIKDLQLFVFGILSFYPIYYIFTTSFCSLPMNLTDAGVAKFYKDCVPKITLGFNLIFLSFITAVISYLLYCSSTKYTLKGPLIFLSFTGLLMSLGLLYISDAKDKQMDIELNFNKDIKNDDGYYL